ncbi:MAG TPA: TRAP transporter small permease subunit [Longimicrobiales bacterium]|nr:TRAP transporter small permease subunit [Longimicrobiales bacterium]
MNDRIGVAIRWAVLVMVVLGAGVTLVRYAARYLGSTVNLTPATEAQWYLFSAIFLLGAAYALRHDVHVRVDVIYERLGTRTRAWIDLLGTLLFLVPFAVAMLVVSWPAVRTSWEIRETSPDPGGLPRYPIKALILVSFVLVLLQALSQTVRLVDTLRGGERAPEAGPEPEGHL